MTDRFIPPPPILDFEKAEESADHTDDAAWHISYNRALEAQAQAAVAKVEALLASERRQCQFAHNALTAAEAKLARVQEYANLCESESLPPLLNHLTEMLND